MKQYWDLKSQELAQGALLLFRMGDFYELFGEDAIEASKILDITLTTRDRNKSPEETTVMAGVPHHSVHHYIQKLLKAGKKIAIAEQISQPNPPGTASGGKEIVTREIVRVLSPAIHFESDQIENKMLACLCPDATSLRWTLGALDASTGHTYISEALSLDEWVDRWSQLHVAHLLISHPLPESFLHKLPKHLLTEPCSSMSEASTHSVLKRAFQVEGLPEFFQSREQMQALGAVMHYALRSQRSTDGHWKHLRLPQPLFAPRAMQMGPRTASHLDLDDLFEELRRTKTSAGTRLLKRWLLEPLKQVSEIGARQGAVQALASHPSTLQNLNERLAKMYDIERILGRIHTGLAAPRDTWALAQSVVESSSFAEWVGAFAHAETLQRLTSELQSSLKELLPLVHRIQTIQNPVTPAQAREGGVFVRGAFEALDRLIDLCENGDRWLLDFEARERGATGIGSLKVKYNRVTGYSIEITKSNLKNVPSHYQRRQSMANAERYVTEELSRFDEERTHAQTRRTQLEEELFGALIQEVGEKTKPFLQWASAVSELDALHSMAKLSLNPGWCFPVIDESSGRLTLVGSRHPMVDLAQGHKFIPNDITLDAHQMMLVTGPNMGGKSTLLRQVAVTAILGQMGSPVPARSAQWGVFDAVFTRIGAHDAIARGQSTFLVEMNELAQILNQATRHSLMVLDEIGRGTSTFDGMSVAWAALEWISNSICARTLFATHYHELTGLQKNLPNLINAHMAVKQIQGGIEFLYTLKPGPSSESFGIHVAKMAGLPQAVIDRAWEVLEDLEKGEHAPHQLSFFENQPRFS